MSKIPRDPRKNKKNRSNFLAEYGIYFILAIIIISAFYFFWQQKEPDHTSYIYSEFVEQLEDNKIKSVVMRNSSGEFNDNVYVIKGQLRTGGTYDVILGGSEEQQNIIDMINDVNKDIDPNNDIDYEYTQVESYGFFVQIISFILPIFIIGLLFFFLMRNSSAGNNRAFDFGKSRARLSRDKTSTFKDVAGCEEEKEELVEIVDFLKNPRKYNEMGARIPKGVLLVGPPGTGKTLLARAVAGEANVPFYSISGSDFVEMFVGVGASRVRDMFKNAKQNAPCIIFIDEIDAVGRQRGAGLGGGHDEREQTLNQLLTEMDGFGANSGIIVMAATNRPDVLDPALLRPGRFDRQIMIDRPDVRGREAILKVHARNKKLAANVKLAEIAKRTPGFSGADLENILNESALLAARANRKYIEMQDIDEATDRVLMGPAKKSKVFTKEERKIVAHHEAGHAVIGLKLENAEIVHKVTIIPRGRAGGYALMLPEEEKFINTKQDLLDQITGLLGGRVSEELIFNKITTGAHNDFQKATNIARMMVTEYGMSNLGPIQYEKREGSVFLGRDYAKDKNFSDQVALEIDKEVRNIITECYNDAKRILNENIDLVKLIAANLLEIETLTKEDIDELIENGKISWWEERKLKENNNKENNNDENKKSIDENQETTDENKDNENQEKNENKVDF